MELQALMEELNLKVSQSNYGGKDGISFKLYNKTVKVVNDDKVKS